MAKKKTKPTPQKWAAKLRGLRDKRGLTQEQAADLAGIPARTWISWENEQHFPADLTRKGLATIFPELA